VIETEIKKIKKLLNCSSNCSLLLILSQSIAGKFFLTGMNFFRTLSLAFECTAKSTLTGKETFKKKAS
jgi:hypothetical protein